MTTTMSDEATDRTAAQRYVEEVGQHLAGLPDDERAEVVDDLRAHVQEVADADERPLEEVLGSPAEFAAELLAAAGLEPAVGLGRAAPRFARARQLVTSVNEHRWTGAVRSFVPELLPAWWVLRGYIAVVAISLMTEGDGRAVARLPFPTIFGSVVVGVPVAIGAIVASVRLGRRPSLSRRWKLLDVALAIALVAVVFNVRHEASRTYVYAPTTYDEFGRLNQGNGDAGYLNGLSQDGVPITNLYVYDADGKLLAGVLVYDQDGRPVVVGDAVDPNTGMVVTHAPVFDANGAPIPNLYPQDQRVQDDPYGTGTTSVSSGEPVPPPAVVVPRTTTTTSPTTTTAPATTTTTTTKAPAPN
jgi:hypothetical protein